MLNALIFDVEGTLMDCVSQTLQSWQRTLQAEGYAISTEQLQPYSGMDAKDMIAALLPNLSHSEVDHLVTQQGERYRRDFIHTVRPFPATTEVLQTLRRRNIRIALATTCQRDELQVYDHKIDWLQYADAVACGNDVPRGKPHPDLFRLALRKLAPIDVGAAMVVGDTLYDAIAAHRVGMSAIGVTTGGFTSDQLEKAGCCRVLKQLGELASYLRDAVLTAATQ